MTFRISNNSFHHRAYLRHHKRFAVSICISNLLMADDLEYDIYTLCTLPHCLLLIPPLTIIRWAQKDSKNFSLDCFYASYGIILVPFCQRLLSKLIRSSVIACLMTFWYIWNSACIALNLFTCTLCVWICWSRSYSRAKAAAPIEMQRIVSLERSCNLLLQWRSKRFSPSSILVIHWGNKVQLKL